MKSKKFIVSFRTTDYPDKYTEKKTSIEYVRVYADDEDEAKSLARTILYNRYPWDDIKFDKIDCLGRTIDENVYDVTFYIETKRGFRRYARTTIRAFTKEDAEMDSRLYALTEFTRVHISKIDIDKR